MADNGYGYGDGMMMGRSSCDWVRAWLPLLVDDSDGLACEGNDLNAEDRRLIEQHLAECSSCRQHQAALEESHFSSEYRRGGHGGRAAYTITLAQARGADPAPSGAIPIQVAMDSTCNLSRRNPYYREPFFLRLRPSPQ